MVVISLMMLCFLGMLVLAGNDLVKKKFIFKANKTFLILGLLIVLSGLLNLCAVSIYDLSPINIRYSIVVFITGFGLIFFQNQNKTVLKFSSRCFLWIFWINALIIVSQVFFYHISLDVLLSIQKAIVVDENVVMLRRPAFGTSLIRPIGIFGSLHGGIYLIAVGAMIWIMKIKKIVSRSFFWLMLMLFFVITGAGQTLLVTIVCCGTYEFLKASRKKKVVICIFIIPAILSIILIWANSISHLDVNTPSTMLGVYSLTGLGFKYFEPSVCFLTGCSLNNNVWEAMISKGSSEYAAMPHYGYLVDNGLINVLLSFGLLFMVFSSLILVIFWKRTEREKKRLYRYKHLLRGNRVDINTKLIILVVGLSQLITAVHYPVGWGLGVVIFLLFSILHLKYRSLISNK